jgi:hypothetical protein
VAIILKIQPKGSPKRDHSRGGIHMPDENRHAKAIQGIARFHLKLLEVSHTNLDMTFEFAEELITVNSPSEFIEVYTKHTRRQFEAMAKQAAELMQLAQEVAIESTGPFGSLFAASILGRPDLA